jgi:hypothetical protein
MSADKDRDHQKQRLSALLYHRPLHPSLPPNSTPYGTAKHYEYLGDLKSALLYYQQAIFVNDRVDSAVKDVAGILNMVGRLREGVEFLKSHEKYIVNKEGYYRLLERMESELRRSEEEEEIGNGCGPLPRTLRLEVEKLTLGQVSMTLCDLLFPNPGKVQRILYLDVEGYIGLVHFATHSAARKALNVKKRPSDDEVKIEWASDLDEIRMRKIDKREKMASNADRMGTSELLPEHLMAFADKTSIPLYSLGDEIVSLATMEAQAACCSIQSNDDVVMTASPSHEITSPKRQPSIAQSPITPLLGTGGLLQSPGSSSSSSTAVSSLLAEGEPFITEISDNCGSMIPAIVFPLPGARNNELPEDPILLTQFILATAHQILAAQQHKKDHSSSSLVQINSNITPTKIHHNYILTPSPLMDRSRFS